MNAHPLTHGRWVLRWQAPASTEPLPVMLLLHGWTGDERVMWVFTRRFPPRLALIALRGLWPTPHGGYSWRAAQDGWPAFADFRPAAEAVLSLLADPPSALPPLDTRRVHLLGFSQGAAFALAFTLMHPERVASLGMLAGFLPLDTPRHVNGVALPGLPVFLAHGSRDPLVPIARAREAYALLTRLGAQVTFCEDAVGHKVSARCLRALEAFVAGLEEGE